MVCHPFVHELLLLALLWLVMISYGTWKRGHAPKPLPAEQPKRRPKAPKPFAGLTHKPHCEGCEQSQKEYAIAILTHFGRWMQPARQTLNGPCPKPRWMPLPELLYAQVVKQYRRRRLVGTRHGVVFGTLAQIRQVLAPLGWHINTAFIEVRPVGRKRTAVLGQTAKLCALQLSSP